MGRQFTNSDAYSQQMANEQDQQMGDAMFMPSEKHDPSFTRWHLELKKELKGFRKQLEGYEEILPNQYKKIGEPVANKEGINGIVLFVGYRVTKISQLTDFTDDDINMIMEFTEDALIGLFYLKWEEWEIDVEVVDSFYESIIDFIYSALTRAKAGWTMKELSHTTRTIENLSPDQQVQQRRGLFSGFGLFGNRGGGQ